MKLAKLMRYAALAMVFCFSLGAYGALAQCDPGEVGYVAAFKVKAGHEAAFETALSNLAAAVNRVEPGVILYAPYRGEDGRYFMMERYKDSAARDAHGKDPAVTALFGPIGEHVDGAPDIAPVSAICSS